MLSREEFTAIFGQLTPKPRSVLILLLENKDDEEIAREIGATEATVRKHVQNLCDRFAVPSEIAGIKKNRRQELTVLASQYLTDIVQDRTATVPQMRPQTFSTNSDLPPVSFSEEPHDWGGATDVSVFYGRSEEIDKLKQWIVEENCRLVAILGMAGIGKTSLSVKVAQELQERFDYIIWRSLRSTPSLNYLLNDLNSFLARSTKFQQFNSVDRNISQLLECFRNSRCLVVLDSFDTILSHGDFAGQYQDDYRDYSQFLLRIGEEPHQSCLILTSQEKPREIALLEGESLPVRSLQLEGLGSAARDLLRSKGLTAEERWGTLIKLYRGNPLALKMVASTIQELFGGNVADFLDMSLTGIVQDIIFLVEQQFERLSLLEKDVMYWLAIEEEAVPLTKLRELLSAPESDLFAALRSLAERSLIEKGSGKFSLQPVVKEYVKNQLVGQICREIDDFGKTQEVERLKLLRTHSLNPLERQDTSNHSHEQSLIALSKERLLAARESRSPSSTIDQLQTIIDRLERNTLQDIGYAKTNLKNLLHVFKEN